MSFLALCPLTMAVQRPTVKQNDVGAPKTTWSTVSGYSAIPCRLTELSATERLLAGREGVESVFRLSWPAGYTVTEADRVVIGGVTYQLEGVLPVYGASAIHHYKAAAILRT